MKLVAAGLMIVAVFSGCQTTQTATVAEAESSLAHSEIHCQIALPSENKQSLIVEARFPGGNEQMSMLVLRRRSGEPAKIIAAPVINNQIILAPNMSDHVAIKLDGAPRIGYFHEQFDESSSSKCVQLHTNSTAVPVKPASCNASGTPAEGWYHGGRVIQHTRNCSVDTLTCGLTPTPGWYVQKKTRRVLAKSERCAWLRDTPICKSGTNATGWHLNDRLIARDDECSSKQIECAGTGSKKEGWYVFERSVPKLLISGACQHGRNSTNRDITYLAH